MLACSHYLSLFFSLSTFQHPLIFSPTITRRRFFIAGYFLQLPATMDLGHLLLLLLLLPSIFLKPFIVTCVEILSKSKLESCVKTSESGNMHCDKKIVVNLAVPSGSVLYLPFLNISLYFSKSARGFRTDGGLFCLVAERW